MMRTLAFIAVFSGCSADPSASGVRAGTVVDPSGESARLVPGRLLVQTDDEAQFQAFLADHHGRLVRTTSRRVRVVELDPGDATIDGYSASDPESLATLALAVAADRPGFEVDVDWLLTPASAVLDRDLHESPVADPAIPLAPWDDNPWSWPHLSTGGAQDTEIADSWRSIEEAGKDVPTVRVAIVDAGFAAENDLVAPVAVYSADPGVPAGSVLGTPNPSTCDGAPCPWHGTNVASVLSAIQGNNIGVAGVASQVIEPVYVYFDGTSSELDDAIDLAVADGADVIAISFTGKSVGVLKRPAKHVRTAVAAAFAADALVVAAAGNNGFNVDAVDAATGVEKATWFPCEFDDVLCVGGLSYDSDQRDPTSNWGGQVDLWMPGTVFVGPDPGDAADLAKVFGGTSAAAAMAAGEAALARAADPGLDAGGVSALLVATSGPSTDPKVSGIGRTNQAVQTADGGGWYEGYVVPGAPFTVPLGLDSDDEATLESWTWTTTPGVGGAAFNLTLWGPTGNQILRSSDSVTCCDWVQMPTFRELGRVTPEWTSDHADFGSDAGEYWIEVRVGVADRVGANTAGLTTATAPLLSLPAEVSGNLRGEETSHNWSVSLQPGETVDVSFDLTGSNDYFVTAYDENGTQVVFSAFYISPGNYARSFTNGDVVPHVYTWELDSYYSTEIEYTGTFSL